ncbi:MAG: hypothetical protein WCA96_15505 [Methylocella sp.]
MLERSASRQDLPVFPAPSVITQPMIATRHVFTQPGLISEVLLLLSE